MKILYKLLLGILLILLIPLGIYLMQSVFWYKWHDNRNGYFCGYSGDRDTIAIVCKCMGLKIQVDPNKGNEALSGYYEKCYGLQQTGVCFDDHKLFQVPKPYNCKRE